MAEKNRDDDGEKKPGSVSCFKLREKRGFCQGLLRTGVNVNIDRAFFTP